MSDIGILGICITSIVVICILVFGLFRQRKGNLKIKTKLADFEIGSEDKEKINETMEVLEGKETISIHSEKPTESINETSRRFFMKAMINVVFDITEYMALGIIQNNVPEADSNDFDRYVAGKVDQIIKIINDCFRNSPNTFVKSLRLVDILGDYYTALLELFKKAYIEYYIQNDEHNIEKQLAGLNKTIKQVVNLIVIRFYDKYV